MGMGSTGKRKGISMKLLALLFVLFSSSSAFGQTFTTTTTAVVDPCPQLEANLGHARGQVASWQNLLAQRQADLAAKQNHLVTLQSWYSLLWMFVNEQYPEPMSPGQQQTLNNLLNAIAEQNAHIAQAQALVQQAHSQLGMWQHSVHQAIMALNASGC
jgi:hypothetical protein